MGFTICFNCKQSENLNYDVTWYSVKLQTQSSNWEYGITLGSLKKQQNWQTGSPVYCGLESSCGKDFNLGYTCYIVVFCMHYSWDSSVVE